MKEIIIYGHADVSDEGFPNEEALIEYLKTELFKYEDCRHRYSQNRKADVIVVSRKGLAYGHLIVSHMENPTADDIASYSKTKKVYVIKSTAVYEKPVKLSELGITGYQFGKSITQEKFTEIQNLGGEITKCFPD